MPRSRRRARSGGARFVGLVFFPKSPRHLGFEQAAGAGRTGARAGRNRAGHRRRPDALLADIAASVRPDCIQPHGAESPQRVAEVRRFAAQGRHQGASASPAPPISPRPPPSSRSPTCSCSTPSRPPAASPAATPLAFDWQVLQGRRFSRPWLLSGGLTPENVAEAITASGAGLVDVSSGVETAPGLKDPNLIAQFLAAAR